MKPTALYRQDETQWSFFQGDKEIRIITPKFCDRKLDFELAQRVYKTLTTSSYFTYLPMVEYASDAVDSPDLIGKWRIIDATRAAYHKLQLNSIVYKKTFTDLPVVVLKIEPDSYLQALCLRIKQWVPFFRNHMGHHTTWILPLDRDNLAKAFFQNGAFLDPFTRLSKKAFQQFESPFVSEWASAGSHHFSLENGELKLRHNSLLSTSKGTEAAIYAYRDLLKQAFEWRTLRNSKAGLEEDLKTYPDVFDAQLSRNAEDQFLGYVKETFGIDFDALIKEGKPLLPDHVYKCNIAASQVEIAHLESFYLRFEKCLKAELLGKKDARMFETVSQFYQFLKEKKVDRYFSFKEIEGIYRSFTTHGKNKSFSAFKDFLLSFSLLPSYSQEGYKNVVHSLTPTAFHKMMGILFCGFEQGEFFTGRRIVHLAICGYKTMGNYKIYDPCRNLSELLHIFPRLQKATPTSYNELLAHVVSKKAMHQCYPSSAFLNEVEWRVGRLIPYPTLDQTSRWYYVDGYLNDGAGNVNYVLIPASKGYLSSRNADSTITVYDKKSPLIKLYRSTASDPEAESSTESLLADLNPKQVGSLHFEKGYPYEQPYFQKCTMPVWVGYLAIGNVDQAVEQFKALSNRENKYANGKEENLIRFLSWQQKDKPLDAVAIYEEFKKKIGADELRKFFTQSALGAEWARERKVAQDLYFVGHSLGAALSQAAFYHFGPDSGRIPLAGCNFECYCFDPPGGITQEQGQKFLEFGRAHRELLRALNQKWGIHYQFEYQDFVPQGGPAWLGVAKESESDADWLDLTATLFKPKSTAKDLDITTLPTHGRRFLHIPKEIAKREYQVIPLNAQELYAFKSSVWLPLELRKKFGYHISTPLLTEKLRKNIGGSVIFALLWMKKKWEDWKNQDEEPDTDVSGVTYYSVDHPNLSKQENNLSI